MANPWIPARAGMLAIVLLPLLLVACASEPDPVVARGPEWEIRRSDVAAEYDRRYGEGTFERATLDGRRDFLTAMVDREILRRQAAEAVPELPAWRQRLVRIGAEEEMLQELRRRDWRSRPPSESRVNAALERIAREARAKAIIVRTKEEAQAAYDAIRGGLAFDRAWARYDSRSPDSSDAGVEWRDPMWFPPLVMWQVYMEDLPEDGILEPIQTRRGVWVTKVLGFRPYRLDTKPGYVRQAQGLLTRMLYREEYTARQDSMKAAIGFERFHGSAEPIVRAVTGYTDSLLALRRPGDSFDESILRPPLWRLLPGEARIPVARFAGDTLTVAEFLTSLDSVDVRYWPWVGSHESRLRSVDVRLDRLLAYRAAVRDGFAAWPEFPAAQRRIEEAAILDEYHDRVLAESVEVRPEEVDSLYAVDPGRWKIPERVEFAAMIFPPEDNDALDAFLEAVRGRSPEVWNAEANRVLDTVDGVEFIATSEFHDVGSTPDPPSWTPLLRAAEAMRKGEIRGPIPAQGAGGAAVVRLIDRMPPRPLSEETARVLVEREIRLRRIDARLEALLDDGRSAVEMWPQRLEAS